MTFTGQGTLLTKDTTSGPCIEVSQETTVPLQCIQGTEAFWGRKFLLQSRTQFQCCYKFSRCASKAPSPTFGDVKALNKLARQLKSQPVKLQFWPLTGPLRIIWFPDDSYRNNEDGSSQRGMTVFLSELRSQSSKDGMSYGSLIDN